MRFVRRQSRSSQRITLEMASMIDVTFLLLIYFMVTTVFARPEDKLSPTIQTRTEQSAGAGDDFQPQLIEVLRLEQGPVYRLGTRVLKDRAALQAAVDRLPKTAGVFIKVHDHVDVGFAVAALQIANDAGFKQVTYVPAQ